MKVTKLSTHILNATPSTIRTIQKIDRIVSPILWTFIWVTLGLVLAWGISTQL